MKLQTIANSLILLTIAASVVTVFMCDLRDTNSIKVLVLSPGIILGAACLKLFNK